MYDQVLNVLYRHMSAIHARSMLTRAVRSCGLKEENDITPEQLPAVLQGLQKGIALFLQANQRKALDDDLRALLDGKGPEVKARKLSITRENDIAEARAEVREISQALGASRMATQRLATVVSELARNMVLYTPGGSIELVPQPRGRTVRVVARDTGSGISNLDDILAGRYESRTGLGQGLLGSRKLCDHFDIQTGSNGTNVEAEVRL